MKCKTIRNSRRNTGENHHDLVFGDEILDTTSKEQSMKENIDKSDCIKIKKLCSMKSTIKRMQRPSEK